MDKIRGFGWALSDATSAPITPCKLIIFHGLLSHSASPHNMTLQAMCSMGHNPHPALLSPYSFGLMPPQECHCFSAKRRLLYLLMEQPVPAVPASPTSPQILVFSAYLRFSAYSCVMRVRYNFAILRTFLIDVLQVMFPHF